MLIQERFAGVRQLRHGTTTQLWIAVPPLKVWKALTRPELVKQYLFGAEPVTDWMVGSPIVYRGVWQGRAFEDKGTILRFIPLKTLQISYWSSLSGLPDAPENYQVITYELIRESGRTLLSVTQLGIEDSQAFERSVQNWGTALTTLKSMLEAGDGE